MYNLRQYFYANLHNPCIRKGLNLLKPIWDYGFNNPCISFFFFFFFFLHNEIKIFNLHYSKDLLLIKIFIQFRFMILYRP